MLLQRRSGAGNIETFGSGRCWSGSERRLHVLAEGSIQIVHVLIIIHHLLVLIEALLFSLIQLAIILFIQGRLLSSIFAVLVAVCPLSLIWVPVGGTFAVAYRGVAGVVGVILIIRVPFSIITTVVFLAQLAAAAA